ncbi:MAG TPA: enoyl-CoA hydratase/isomerase family protein [Rhodanobacteraceae bacterium]|nr:enoyl-CoA hydratase/isomerase family protein [Rhodanobacteraceae bacterium]
MLEKIEHEHGIRELRLARPPVNALNPELVRALRDAVQAAPREGAVALIVSGSSGIFSAGLDVPFLLTLDREGMRGFWSDFLGMCAALARSPIPIVAAITGHSPAGGAVIALFCDFRVMAHGTYRIGLNEVQVGLTIPDVIRVALGRLLGAYRAERLLVSGAMLESEAALRAGMVDELADVDHVVTRARGWLEDLLKLPRRAMLSTRELARADLSALFADPANLPLETLLEMWFAPEAQDTLRAMVERLKAKKA